MTTATTASTTPMYDYDMIVIGGGSGGIAAAKRSATIYGQKVAIIEGNRLGGTCVNVGCVPKKIMYQAASIYETITDHAKHYSITTPTPTTGMDDTNSTVQFDWTAIKVKRDKYIERLNGIYRNGLVSANVTFYEGWGQFIDNHTIEISSQDGTDNTETTTKKTIITGNHIVIATGGRPDMPIDVIGAKEYAITSDEFFNNLTKQPKKVVIAGAGYIAVELACMMSTLGTQVHLILRHDRPLRTFDTEISTMLHTILTTHTKNLTVHCNTLGLKDIVKTSTNSENEPMYTVTLLNNEIIDTVDCVIMAVGRHPNIDGLGLDNLANKIELNRKNEIIVNEYQTTSISNIYALGDVANVGFELTPVAIAAGRRLADRLFSTHPTLYNVAKIQYDSTKIPTVVFSHPPIGTIGLTEQQAIEQYGVDNIKIYRSTFVNLYYSIFDVLPQDKPKTFVKLIVHGSNEKIIGLHIIGIGADELLQGFGVAIAMGATKADFDNCVAIHPTAAEEVVTLHPWGLTPQQLLYPSQPSLSTTTSTSTTTDSKM